MDQSKKVAIQQECLVIFTELMEVDGQMTFAKIMNLVQVELRGMPLFFINDDTLLSALKCLRYALMGGEDNDKGMGST